MRSLWSLSTGIPLNPRLPLAGACALIFVCDSLIHCVAHTDWALRVQEEWMRTFFQPQQYEVPPHYPAPQVQQRSLPTGARPPMRGGPPNDNLYASNNSVRSDGAMSVLSNADDYQFDPTAVPKEFFQAQAQYQVIEFERHAHMQEPMHQQPRAWGQPHRGQHWPQHASPNGVEYTQRTFNMPLEHPMPGPAIATIGVALWLQGRYFAIASITPGSDASRCGLRVRCAAVADA